MQRQISLDCARGFTVLFVPAIHCVMVFSQPYVHTTWFGYLLTFIAEGPGAQIFMTIMGIVFTFKRKYTVTQVVNRAALLLAAGYALNAAKFIVPFALGVLPVGVQRDLQLTNGNEYLQLLLMGDVLQFAAIALLTLYAVYQLNHYFIWSSVLALAVLFCSPMFWDSTPDNYLAVLFTGQPPQVFFPVFPWIVYPLMGLTVGYFLQKNAPITYQYCGVAGVISAAVGGFYFYLDPQVSAAGFYRTYPAETFLHVAVVLITLWAWQKLTPIINRTLFFTATQFASRHITMLYITQWIFICWLLPFTGYQTMNLVASLMMVAFVSTLIFGGHYLFIHRKELYGHEKNI